MQQLIATRIVIGQKRTSRNMPTSTSNSIPITFPYHFFYPVLISTGRRTDKGLWGNNPSAATTFTTSTATTVTNYNTPFTIFNSCNSTIKKSPVTVKYCYKCIYHL